MNAVLAGDPPRVVARAGDVAPNTGGAIFESFDPPLISEAGIAFSAKLKHGPGIDATNDTGVWTEASQKKSPHFPRSPAVGSRSARAAPLPEPEVSPLW